MKSNREIDQIAAQGENPEDNLIRISILTMFPESFDSFLATPVVKRAIDRKIAQIDIVDIKSFAGGSFRHIDDSPYGGGPGMILKCGPVLDALDSVRTKESHVAIFSPTGEAYTQEKAVAYAQLKHIVLICGHYEGYDARIENFVDETISVGDYVLTGGELPSMIVTDSIVRLLHGVLRRAATAEESFTSGLLEYDQYTMPAEFRGLKVPEVLLSGNHERIRKWRLAQSLKKTYEKRKDLWDKHELSEEERALFEEAMREQREE